MSESVRTYRRLARKSPKDPRTWFGLGRAYVESGDDALGRLAFLEAIDRSTLAGMLFDIGDTLQQMGYEGEAFEAYRRASSLPAEDLETLIRTASFALDVNEPHRALELLEPIVGQNDDVRVRTKFAQALAAVGRNEEAIEYVEAVIVHAPMNTAALHVLGRAATQNADYETAARAYRTIVSIGDGNDVAALTALAIAYTELGDHDEAIALLTEVTERDAESAEAFANLGTALLAADDARSALRALETAVGLDESSAQAQCMLGAAMQVLGRLPDAGVRFEGAIRLAPEWPVPRYNLGMVLLELGEAEEALEVLEEAARLAPNDAEVKIALARAAETVDEKARFDVFNNEGSDVTGDLAAFRLPELLEFLRLQQSSGSLAVVCSSGAGVIRLHLGAMTSAVAPQCPRLGEILVRRGLIRREMVVEVLADRDGSDDDTNAERLGELLTSRGLVSPKDVREALYEQIVLALSELANWTGGHFAFHRATEERAVPDIATFSIQHAMLEAMRRTDEANR